MSNKSKLDKNDPATRKGVEYLISNIRTYSGVDLVRFHKMALDNPGVSMAELRKMYNAKHPITSASDKIDNVIKALNTNQ